MIFGREISLSQLFAEGLFEPDREAELDVAIDWFWSVRSAIATQIQRATVRQFWAKTLERASKKGVGAEPLLGRLSRLVHFIEDLDDKSFELLAPVVPYAGVDFNFHDVVDQISRLAPTNYARAAELVGLLISRTKPIYDMEDAFALLLKTLAANGQKNAVLVYVNALLPSLPNMTALYNEVLKLPD